MIDKHVSRVGIGGVVVVVVGVQTKAICVHARACATNNIIRFDYVVARVLKRHRDIVKQDGSASTQACVYVCVRCVQEGIILGNCIATIALIY